jgi:hypothetical protein
MEKLKYVNQGHLDKILKYLEETENWTYYYMIYNMVHTGLSFSQLKKKKGDLLIPKGIPEPPKNPFSLHIRTVNKQLKVYFVFAGIHDVLPSTFSFINKMTLDGQIFYGMSPRSNTQQPTRVKKEGIGFIYLVRHIHNNPIINNLLTDKKIGVSINVKGRMNSLTLGTIGLEVLKVWELDLSYAYKLEKKIHKILHKRHLVGEWFEDSDNTLINELLSIMDSNSIVEVDFN